MWREWKIKIGLMIQRWSGPPLFRTKDCFSTLTTKKLVSVSKRRNHKLLQMNNYDNDS